ncbi:hexulose-6-phosphate isomerase [Bacillus niacini]|uniref:Hexulose-6-phosphate isomerase n=1 Tax=Neobacillus niacini TaxID=86668 RepID=A0A852TJ57_9BACI|nr:sugar phosphate isomerase/epimerase family protein [Neobacillus niacini]NYE09010.1 hexulose-6-phosphate isomerase [Neobacillus niacini]
MKKGVNHWCFPETWSFERVIETTAKAHFDGIELNMAESGMFSLTSSDAELITIRDKVRNANLEIPSLSTSLLWKYSLTSNNKKEREKGKSIVQKMIDAAALLQIKTILVVPGVVNQDVSYDAAYSRALEALGELSAYAEEAKVEIGVENVWNKFLLSPIEMKNFIHEIGSEAVGVYFDVGNVLNYGYPEQWISILNGHIKKVHVKDFITAAGNHSGFTSLLQGDVNWKNVIEALKNIGYEDYLTAEIPPHLHFPEKLLNDISDSINFMIKEGWTSC